MAEQPNPFDGKRTDRFRLPRQLGLNPEIGLIVRSRSQRRGRSIEMQLVHFITVGIQHDPEARFNEDEGFVLHSAAHDGTNENDVLQTPAQPRKSRQTDAHRRTA